MIPLKIVEKKSFEYRRVYDSKFTKMEKKRNLFFLQLHSDIWNINHNFLD